ncbi:MAG: Ldh family oxidoreductase [Alphaproteobacteria bacterium]|jgi:(2R)-3-sulfolactate dehydrogenase (NADP+)|nr:Ldh family oxidoreductase [Alphaproteobacteria bacterium]
MTGVTLSLADLHDLAVRVLVANDTGEANAEEVAKALVAAEADGLKGHGASRLPSYAAQAKSGKVQGHAVPDINEVGSAALWIDANEGFAYPAITAAIDGLAALAPATGIAAAGIANSHHFGAAGYHVERMAERGLIGLAFGNSPQAIAPWGGSKGLFGTNPIAFAAPRREAPPLVIDMGLSKVARGNVMVAARAGEPIPEGWALDADGKPTTDAEAAMDGTMVAMGDAKGTALVMMVEILAVALTASNFSYEASSFFTADGPAPRTGQFLMAIDPYGFSAGAFADRLEDLIAAVREQDGTRLPGERRLALRAEAEANGVEIPQDLHDELLALAG